VVKTLKLDQFLNNIRVIPFCGNVDERPIWSERLSAKSRHFGFKELWINLLSEVVAMQTQNDG
jgi:hypothetical protein